MFVHKKLDITFYISDISVMWFVISHWKNNVDRRTCNLLLPSLLHTATLTNFLTFQIINRYSEKYQKLFQKKKIKISRIYQISDNEVSFKIKYLLIHLSRKVIFRQMTEKCFRKFDFSIRLAIKQHTVEA